MAHSSHPFRVEIQIDETIFPRDPSEVTAGIVRIDQIEPPLPAHPTKMDRLGFTTFFETAVTPFWIVRFCCQNSRWQ